MKKKREVKDWSPPVDDEGSDSPAKFNPLSFDGLGQGAEVGSAKAKMASNRKEAMPIPLTAPGFRRTGKLLHDLNKMYGAAALKNAKIRAELRRKYKGQIEISEIDGKWQIRHMPSKTDAKS